MRLSSTSLIRINRASHFRRAEGVSSQQNYYQEPEMVWQTRLPLEGRPGCEPRRTKKVKKPSVKHPFFKKDQKITHTKKCSIIRRKTRSSSNDKAACDLVAHVAASKTRFCGNFSSYVTGKRTSGFLETIIVDQHQVITVKLKPFLLHVLRKQLFLIDTSEHNDILEEVQRSKLFY